ncbi:MAG: flavodoxin family protein [Treponema sp.]|jgi:multimeric flavodoxin WrbA|nr:flavodoxin family protein [Treponema sp.]
MKVIAINGSSHKNGTTFQAMQTVIQELEAENIEVEVIHIGSAPIQGCIGCGKCSEIGKCVFDNDPVNYCAEKLKAADGVLIGSPVYYAGINGALKAFLDRLFYSLPSSRYKVGAAVIALRRSGGMAAFHQINTYFSISQMIVTPNLYWNIIHGNSAEEALQDDEGMLIMKTLGRNMAWLLKAVDMGKKALPLPETDKRVWTNFIRD